MLSLNLNWCIDISVVLVAEVTPFLIILTVEGDSKGPWRLYVEANVIVPHIALISWQSLTVATSSAFFPRDVPELTMNSSLVLLEWQ